MVDLVPLGYNVDTSGLVKGEKAVKHFAQTNYDAAKATLDFAKRQELSAKAALVSAQASGKATQKQIQRLQSEKQLASAALASARAIEAETAATLKSSQAAKTATRSAQRFGGSFGGIAAQFQDVGVSIAGGMSPGIVALQQGTQIAGQLELAMRSGASASAVLRSAFASLVSPVSLVTIGVTALAGILLQQSFSSWGGEAVKLEDRLDRVSQALKRLKDLGREVEEVDLAKALNDSFKNIAIDENIRRIKLEAENLKKSLAGVFGAEVSGFRVGDFGRTNLAAVKEELEAVGKNGQYTIDVLQRLASEASTGAISVEKFVSDSNRIFDNVVKLAPESADAVEELRSGMVDLATEVVRTGAQFSNADQNIRTLSNGVQVAGPIMDAALKVGEAAAHRLARETEVAQQQAEELRKKLDRLDRHFEADFVLNVSLDGDVGKVEYMLAAIGAPESLIDRARQQRFKFTNQAGGTPTPGRKPLDLNAPGVKSRRGGGPKQNEFERQIESIQKRTQAIQAQATTFNMSTEAAARYKAQQDLINAANEAGISLSPTVVSSIDEQASAYAAATARLEQMRDRQQSIQGISQILYNGVKGARSFSDALRKVANSLLDVATQGLLLGKGPLAGLFGGGGQKSGGLFGSVLSGLFGAFGFANGGAFGPGGVQAFATGGVVNRPTVFPFANGVGLMGEAGAEAIMPLRRLGNGRLGVEASGGGGARAMRQPPQEVVVSVNVNSTEDFETKVEGISSRQAQQAAGGAIARYDKNLNNRLKELDSAGV